MTDKPKPVKSATAKHAKPVKTVDIFGSLKKKMTAINKEYLSYTETLQEDYYNLQEGFARLMKEEDIVNLPSYKLLKLTYGEFLRTPGTGGGVARPGSSKSSAKKKDTTLQDSYPDMYMPPKMRNKTRLSIKKKMDITQTLSRVGAGGRSGQTVGEQALAKCDAQAAQTARAASSSFSSDQPDFGTLMLDTKKKKKLVPPSASSNVARRAISSHIKVTVPPSELVYAIEMQGTRYLRYKTHLYDAQTHERVGDVLDVGFKTAAEEIPVSTLATLEPLTEQYYIDGDDFVFVLVNDSIAQRVGKLKGEELDLWA